MLPSWLHSGSNITGSGIHLISQSQQLAGAKTLHVSTDCFGDALPLDS